MKATQPFVLCLALSFVVVTLVGCNPAPPPAGSKAGDKSETPAKPVKPGKAPANTTG